MEKEKCVMCGKEVNIPKNLHVDYRDGYVEGAGQLCPICQKKLSEKGV